ncbi:[protein-PII] uridylyltransferase [Endothiovibrio diazotrophicus]
MNTPPTFDLTQFEQSLVRALGANEPPGPLFKQAVAQATGQLESRCMAGEPIRELVHARADFMDRLLTLAWNHVAAMEGEAAALAAVGGYGRRELHPASDIDLLILLPAGCDDPLAQRIEPFLRMLWDVGLEIGSSVRSPEEAIELAAREVTVITNLIESRLLAGDPLLFETVRQGTAPERIWPSTEFFAAKLEEQRARHRRYGDTAYNLEPNIKESPGGLRDLASIGWVAKRHFGVQTFRDLIPHGFLTEAEYEELMACEAFLWRIRFGIHTLTGRHDDRLLFDHQRPLAERIGYRERNGRMAVEHLMHDYYRTVQALSRLNEMLLQFFEEEILYRDADNRPQLLTQHFQARKGFLEVRNPPLFPYRPFALMEVFLLLAQHPELKGVRAGTIRLIRENLYRVDDAFRCDVRARDYFMELLRQPRGITLALRKMHRYGVLAAYLPVFGRIEGQMQYDLFHTYTVDEHTLFVLRNTRRIFIEKHAGELPLASAIAKDLPKPELLHIAALFHDIAKGRGGDHSTLGEQEAEVFCAGHGLSEWDTRLVSWLVRNHLLMSSTAQRKDVDDPEVIHEFATRVGEQTRLDYLYLLTVADIRATNPELWTSWKASLLRELYGRTKRALRRGLENPEDRDERITEIRKEARAQLIAEGIPSEAIERVWAEFDDDYFLRHNPAEVAWHTTTIACARPGELPLVEVRLYRERGGTAIFVYAPDNDRLFAHTASVLEQLDLSVADARIIGSRDHRTLDTYIVMESDGRPVEEGHRCQAIRQALRERLVNPDAEPVGVNRRLPRRHKHMAVTTQIHLSLDERRECTILELFTLDRPGLLSRVGRAFTRCGVRLHSAKIGTFGSHVEDVFFLTDQHNLPLDDTAGQCLRGTIRQLLDETD